MKKIPTLFKRDADDMRKLTREVHPDCQWVLDGEGIATRKFDGTCVMIDAHGRAWARREVKPDKGAPAGFVMEQYDETTGKTVGWEPAEQSSFWKFIQEAGGDDRNTKPGTYELCGPKIQKNPEGFERHVLIPHGWQVLHPPDLSFDGLRDWMTGPDWAGFEGVVWHHSDGRMAKIKTRDFRFEGE
jgi:hypothetical protein